MAQSSLVTQRIFYGLTVNVKSTDLQPSLAGNIRSFSCMTPMASVALLNAVCIDWVSRKRHLYLSRCVATASQIFMIRNQFSSAAVESVTCSMAWWSEAIDKISSEERSITVPSDWSIQIVITANGFRGREKCQRRTNLLFLDGFVLLFNWICASDDGCRRDGERKRNEEKWRRQEKLNCNC